MPIVILYSEVGATVNPKQAASDLLTACFQTHSVPGSMPSDHVYAKFSIATIKILLHSVFSRSTFTPGSGTLGLRLSLVRERNVGRILYGRALSHS